MTSYLSMFQALSIIGYSALLFILVLCPYKGEEFKTYNKVRHLLMTAIGILIMQFVVQLIFGFRAKSLELGATCNMAFVMVVAQIVIMVVYKLLRRDSSCRKEWIWTTVASVINLIVLIAGARTDGGVWMKYTVCFSLLFYAIVNITFYSLALKEYMGIHKKMQQYYSFPIEKHTTWILIFIIDELIICFMLPVTLTSNNLTMVLGVVSYFCFVYFSAKLMYYGYYAISVEHAETAIAQDMQEDINISDLNRQYTAIEISLKDWINKRRFCEQGITLDTIVRDIKAPSRLVLSHYFRDCLTTTFRDWLNILRTDYGKKMIEDDPTLSIEYVADKCGFATRSYFDILFKERFYITPAIWRKQCFATPHEVEDPEYKETNN